MLNKEIKSYKNTYDRKIVIKLGGSIVTRKDVDEFPLDIDEIKERSDEYIRYDVVRRIGKELKEAMDERRELVGERKRIVGERDLQFILINGAGPFGHYLVKYRRPDEDVRESVRHLNEKLVSEFRKIGLRAVPVAPSKSCEFVNGEFDISYLWELASVLIEEEKILSTYGDMLQVGKVISGDDLFALLAYRWKADKIITATDVDGLHTKDPKIYKDAKLIKRLDGKLGLEGVKAEYTTKTIDVTGSMAYKVEKLIEASRYGIKGQIINGLKEGNVKATLLGDETIGTLILP